MTRKKKLQRPSELLSLYSRKLTHELEKKLSPIAFELNFQYRSLHTAYISGYVVFRPGWVLEFDEIIEQEKVEINKRKYRYHLMDKAKQLIFRYDNVSHFPEIKSYPHHKHIEGDVVESKSPQLLEVIGEIEKLIIKEKL